MLRALGYGAIERFHMNEGHAALLALELLDESARAAGRTRFEHADVERVRKMCVFTTPTPVAAGHDQFPLDLAKRVLGRPEIYEMHEVFCLEGVPNMTYLALTQDPERCAPSPKRWDRSKSCTQARRTRATAPART